MTTKLYCDLCGHEIEEKPVSVKVTPFREWARTYHFHEGCFETLTVSTIDSERRKQND